LQEVSEKTREMKIKSLNIVFYKYIVLDERIKILRGFPARLIMLLLLVF
jgi:hypothetical protein